MLPTENNQEGKDLVILKTTLLVHLYQSTFPQTYYLKMSARFVSHVGEHRHAKTTYFYAKLMADFLKVKAAPGETSGSMHYLAYLHKSRAQSNVP